MNTQLGILSIEHVYERTAVRVLLALLCIALAGYVYFVGASILNIIARKEAARATASLQSRIAVMEKQYFALSEEATPSAGQVLGLLQLSGAEYVYRPGTTAAAPSADTIDRNAI